MQQALPDVVVAVAVVAAAVEAVNVVVWASSGRRAFRPRSSDERTVAAMLVCWCAVFVCSVR